jgi:hypothetical protein
MYFNSTKKGGIFIFADVIFMGIFVDFYCFWGVFIYLLFYYLAEKKNMDKNKMRKIFYWLGNAG